MAAIDRVRTTLTGFGGAPGVATMYFNDAVAAHVDLKQFWANVAIQLPVLVTATVDTSGDQIDDVTGTLIGSWSTGTATPAVGQKTGTYAAGVGLSCTWTTSSILDGSRVRGRTYVVPMPTSAYDLDGSIIGDVVGFFEGICAQLVTAQANNFVVWHRPRLARVAVGTIPARAARAGGHSLVNGSVVRDKVAILRSRRD